MNDDTAIIVPADRVAARVQYDAEAELAKMAGTLRMALSRISADMRIRLVPSEVDLSDIIATATAMLAMRARAQAAHDIHRVLSRPQVPTLAGAIQRARVDR